MRIKIIKALKKSRFDLSDLLTRQVGKAIYRVVEKKLGYVGEGEVVEIDFREISVIDPSFIDEFLIKLVKKSREMHKMFFIRLVNLSKVVERSISIVLKMHNGVSQEKITIPVESISEDNKYCLGVISNDENEIIKLLKINGILDFEKISEMSGISSDELKKILDNMMTRNIIRKTVDGLKFMSI